MLIIGTESRGGHDALFAQGLDNPLWVAHMTHPTGYDYDGFHHVLE